MAGETNDYLYIIKPRLAPIFTLVVDGRAVVELEMSLLRTSSHHCGLQRNRRRELWGGGGWWVGRLGTLHFLT